MPPPLQRLRYATRKNQCTCIPDSYTLDAAHDIVMPPPRGSEGDDRLHAVMLSRPRRPRRLLAA
eukprot:7220205-Alexandrium_andersonii.AAC.1